MKQYIYILTDCNRSCLHVGYTEDLLKTINFYKEKQTMFFGAQSVISRLIYFEEFSSEELALARFDQMCIYTRPQKENLIRSVNPNWTDLAISLVLQPSYHPGAKFRPNVPNLTSLR
jgi:putative endonuclease